MDEILKRGWENLVGRSDGPMSFRLLIQPAMAMIFAIRRGLRDTRAGRPPMLWAIISNPGERPELLRQGWKDVGTVFIVALILDSIYQVIVHKGIFTLELLITATVLAVIPYIIFRGLVTWIASLAGYGKQPDLTPDRQIPIHQERHTMNSDSSTQHNWTKPAAMAIPKEGFFELEQGRYGPIYPRTPACYGFTIIAKIKPGREAAIREYGKTIEKTIAGLPDGLAVLKLHYLRWVLFDIAKDTYFMYQGIFDTDFDKYTEDAVALFSKYGLNTVFENLDGFPEDWKTNTPAFIKFVREHQCPSFLEYGEYPYVSADEIKKALKLKAAFSSMLEQMQ